MPMRVFGIVLVLAALAAALTWHQVRPRPLVVSGHIEADEIRVGSRVGGRVKEVLVVEGETVTKGQPLVRLEPYDLAQRLAEAQARLASAGARWQMLSAGFRPEEVDRAKALRDQSSAAYAEAMAGPRKQEIEEARASLRLAQAELELADIEYRRSESLLAAKAISREAYDQHASRRRVAQATLEAREHRLKMLEEGTRQEQKAQAKANLDAKDAEWRLFRAGYRGEEIAEAKAQLDAANADVDAIGQQLAELEILAPLDATIEALELQPGDLVVANAPVISLLDASHMWVRLYVPQRYLGQMSLGQSWELRVDEYPGRLFHGRVSFIARQGEFTPGNVQTPEERGKQVFRVKIQLDDGYDVLRPGMSAELTLRSE
jgi:multidrug resistance efflux pump